MGSASSIPQEHVALLSPKVFEIVDHDLQQGALHIDRTDETLNLNDADLFDRVQVVVAGATKEADLPLAECRCPAVVLYKYKQMTPELQQEFCQAVFDASVHKDRAEAQKHHHPNSEEFAKSFGGTVQDHTDEMEAANLLRGDNSLIDLGILNQPDMIHPSEHTVLRQAGTWRKFLSATGCYLYIHPLTRDLVSVKPDDYIEETTNQGDTGAAVEVEVDPANGLPKVPLTELPAMVEHIVKELNKTPLIIDTSESEVVRTYYSYKANVADASQLTIPYGKSGVKTEDVMERCRKVLVSSMKKGQLFVLYLGATSIEHADIKGKLCKKDVFPKDVFTHAGQALLGPDYEPKYKRIYREEDLESGEAIVRDGFHTAVITSLSPFEYEKKLEDCIPLGYMHPIYVIPNK